MRWVKATSDTLPPQATGKEICVKVDGRCYSCLCIAKKFAFREGTFPGSDILTEKDYHRIEWLDESIPTPSLITNKTQ